MGRAWAVWAIVLWAGVGRAQQQPRPLPHAPLPEAQAAHTAPHRTRLVLKDGSYQLVMSYQVKGNVVSYVSAERGGTEEIPNDLVDWDATHKWEQRHPAVSEDGQAPALSAGANPAIDPELIKEEADRKVLTPEVAPDLELPEQDSVLALDYFQGTPELVPLVQSAGDLNHTTSHNILKLVLNPAAASHEVVSLKGVTSPVQMHVATPVIYLRLGDDAGVSHGSAPFVVDTHGANPRGIRTDGSGGSAASGYVFVRADVRTDSRVVVSFSINSLGTMKKQEDVIETTAEVLPGGHWMKLTPAKPLDFGEYALMEVVSDREINTGVWDFGVHPVAPENRDVIKPQSRRPVTLERRAPQ